MDVREECAGVHFCLLFVKQALARCCRLEEGGPALKPLARTVQSLSVVTEMFWVDTI